MILLFLDPENEKSQKNAQFYLDALENGDGILGPAQTTPSNLYFI